MDRVDGAVIFPNTYLLDSDFSSEWLYVMFEQLGPGLSFWIFFLGDPSLLRAILLNSIADGYPNKEQAKTS